MPIYEYECPQCEHQIEIMHKISESPELSCSECGHQSLKRLISASRFKLKGSGWYETDFKNNNKKPQTDTNSSDTKGQASASSTESKGD